MNVHQSHVDWFLHDPQYAGVPKELRAVGQDAVTMLRFDQPPGAYVRPNADELTLQLLLNDAGVARVDHGTRFDCAITAGSLAISPSGTDLSYSLDHKLLGICATLPSERLQRPIEARTGRRWSGDFGPLSFQLFEHQALRGLLLHLWDEAASGSALGALYADSAWDTVALALYAACGERLPLRGGLAPWQERRATEYLGEHLGENVTLADLAATANLSTFHFARQFKQSTGLPPHAYQRRLRCERAKALLTGTDLPMTEIAAQVGYETPQAFARMFRAEVGASPSDYRRERRQ